MFYACYGHGEYDRTTSEIWVEGSFELFFLISFIKNFLTDFTPEGEHHPVRKLSRIFKKYIKGYFFLDFIPLIPFTLLLDEQKYKHSRLLYLIKVTRILKAMDLFDVQGWVSKLKELKTDISR